MRRINRIHCIPIMCFVMSITFCSAQIPVELFAGHQKSTLDVLFFRLLSKDTSIKTNILFFNRNRAGIDYRMTDSSYLPQFGATEAISLYNQSLMGVSPVIVGQILNNGLYSKLGIQYAQTSSSLTVFSWFVYEILKNSSADHFLLLRFTPSITNSLAVFFQGETITTISSDFSRLSSATQRVRIGVQLYGIQSGFGADFSQLYQPNLVSQYNFGIFLRGEL